MDATIFTVEQSTLTDHYFHLIPFRRLPLE